MVNAIQLAHQAVLLTNLQGNVFLVIHPVNLVQLTQVFAQVVRLVQS